MKPIYYYNPKMFYYLLLILILGLQSSLIVLAQESSSKTSVDLTPLETGNVVTQFDFVLDKSVKSEDSRMIKSFWLFRLKAHVVDTVKTLTRKCNGLQTSLNKVQFQVDSLKKQVELYSTSLSTAKNEKEQLKVIGISVKKSFYHGMVWGIIGGLSLVVVILIWLFKRSNSTTVRTKADLEELKIEYEAHRKRALEREAQLSRKHLDEINKLKHYRT